MSGVALANGLNANLVRMGIPLIQVQSSDTVGGWKMRDRWLALITHGHSRRWTSGFERKTDAATTFDVCAGRMDLFVGGAVQSESLG